MNVYIYRVLNDCVFVCKMLCVCELRFDIKARGLHAICVVLYILSVCIMRCKYESNAVCMFI